MSPKAQAVTGLVTGGLILLAAALLIAFTQFWWLIFIFGWAVFPAFGVFVRASLAWSILARSLRRRTQGSELLEALQSRGELTPAQAAMETSLTVNEADEMLKDLAAKGHLDVRVRGGGLLLRTVGDRLRSRQEEARGRVVMFLSQHAHGIIQDPKGVFGA